MSKTNKLYAHISGQRLGVLEQDKGGKIVFRYEDAATRPLSCSLPLEGRSFTARRCQGYFNGLLPESDVVRQALAKRYGISARNDFSMLSKIGYDCPGAVSFSDDESWTSAAELPLEGVVINEDDLEQHLRELPRKPLATGVTGVRLSLAGAQDKTAMIMLEGELALPSPETPSTHILKPAIHDLQTSVENEYLCLRAAREIGLHVPDVRMNYANSTPYFLIERYDREIVNGKVRRIHQEDFCQALNIVSAQKYEKEGGPNLQKCFELIEQCQRPIVVKKELLARVLFNYLIGNADAHGKNFSLLHLDDGSVQLAPCYDILCTQIYTEMDRSMAMRLGKHDLPHEVTKNDFAKWARRCQLNMVQIQEITSQQIKKLPSILEKLGTEHLTQTAERIHEQTQLNTERLTSLLDL